ncbi:hypothetical protein N7535_009238 [Penicillium sp. DV-2018c]|nr:hypothetical protein N7535_009238 [Penicillium sp. DV-2018c]
MDRHVVLDWYNTLEDRIVDLVGDFAGDELFLIDGDSLLLECFSNKHLNFNPGFQVLHATYLAEKLLQMLQQRKCVFQVVFFEQNAPLCIPIDVHDDLHDRYFLAREAIIQHLLAVRVQPSQFFQTLRFDSYESDEFRAHLSQIPRYKGESSLALRKSSTYLQCIQVMGMVIERSMKTFSQLPGFPATDSAQTADQKERQHTDTNPLWKALSQLKIGNDKDNGKDVTENSQVKKLSDPGKALELVVGEPGLSQRQCLLVVTLSTMLAGDKADDHDTRIGAEAMLLHLALLQDARLSDRSITSAKPKNLKFFNQFVNRANALLSSKLWEEAMKLHHLPCDLSDLMDGTLFFEVQLMVENLGISNILSPATISSFNNLARLVDQTSNTRLQYEASEGVIAGPDGAANGKAASEERSIRNYSHCFEKVLPFSNPIFDEHLKPVQLTVDDSADMESDGNFSKGFEEKSHWHSSKPLDQKKVILTPQQASRALKRNQFFMAEMRDYAASLTGSAGILKPEPIIVGPSSDAPKKSHQKPLSAARDVEISSKSKKSQPTTGKGSSTRENAAAYLQQKSKEATQKQRQKWKKVFDDEFAQSNNLVTRFIRLNEYLTGLSKESRQVLEADVLTCMVDTLVRVTSSEKLDARAEKHISIVTNIWQIVTRLMKVKQGISVAIAKYIETITQLLGLPAVQLRADTDYPLAFKLFEIPTRAPSMKIDMTPVEFQLAHGGPFMDRSIDSKPDSRTPDFEPDSWQRDVLDQIDAKKSAFIVAPTSAGKTFISFYAMRQVLKEDNDGILVYVAPTKALVNQIAAEVQARFTKMFPTKTTGKSVWAIHTGDYRINNPMGCQVLVTVPSILQVMLLAPANANAWTPRIRRIIFDEVHCIGQAEDGVIWEQLLLMAPCPIIALSATIGNPDEFYDWLRTAQRANGIDLKMIQHRHRYSDLRKYVYQPRANFSFNGFPSTVSLPRLGLDHTGDMTFIHPVTSLVDRTRSIPDDLDLEPRDCFTLWKAMKEQQTARFPVDPSLDPSVFFSDGVIQKIHVIEWQRHLKQLLGQWMTDHDSPFEVLRRSLEPAAESEGKPENKSSTDVSQQNSPSDDLVSTTLQLIFSLHAQNALPALFFNYDRTACENICQALLTKLQKSEADWKKDSPRWKEKVDKWEKWKTSKSSAKKKLEKATKKRAGNEGDESLSKADQARDSASSDFSWLDLFDPEKPVEGFHLADFKKVPASDFDRYASSLRYRQVPEWLIDALERGIGVHHAGMNRKYRQICEILFRKGFLRVVIATGTLALGINMPCKTVVFSGDSISLTALNFRQAAGRAGRRGFDVLGNVVFQQVPSSKAKRLISSRLPSLTGHFPITTSLVLRLFILQHGSNRAPAAVKSINSILSCPQIYLGGPEMKHTVLHHLRFSIEYLRRNHLLSIGGAPIHFAGCVSHLYYTENSSFAFHALLQSGYLQELCQDIERKPERTLRDLMLVMAHLFGRIPLRQSTLEWYQSTEKKPSSVVALPPLPKKAESALRAHNERVRDTYTGYVSTFVSQHVQGPDRYLPFSGNKCGGESSTVELGFSQFKPISTTIVSPFYGLSGNGDICDTVYDLSEKVRSGVWLEDSVIPYVAVSPEENATPLNAYLFDFFKHGMVSQLETANRIGRGDVWYLLNDFSLILATVKTSIEGYLNPGGNIDAELLDLTGGGDIQESTVEEKAIDLSEAGSESKANVQPAVAEKAVAAKPQARSRAKVVVDSWEDESEEDEPLQLTASYPFDIWQYSSCQTTIEAGHANHVRLRLRQGAAPSDLSNDTEDLFFCIHLWWVDEMLIPAAWLKILKSIDTISTDSVTHW